MSIGRSARLVGFGLLVLAGCRPLRVSPEPASARADATAAGSTDAPAEPARACVAECRVQSLYAGDHPSLLRLDDAHLYFVQKSTLYRLPRAGGPAEAILDEVSWGRPVVGDAALYACRRGDDMLEDILRLPRSGGAPTVVARAARCTLATVGDHVYFPARDDKWQQWLARAPLEGGETQRLAKAKSTVDAIVADGAHVYWADGAHIGRLDPASGESTTLVPDVRGSIELAVTDTDVVWWEGSDVMARAKRDGATARVVANYQNVLDFAVEGGVVYWASVRNEVWSRVDLAAGDGALIEHAVPGGSSAVVVDGTRVWWTVFDEEGGIFTLDTCACGPDVLAVGPAIRAMRGPDQEDALRGGWAEDGRIVVQVRDLSSDEHDAVQRLDEAYGGGEIPPGARDVPSRFPIGDAYRVASEDGVVDAHVVGWRTSLGGEGTYLELLLETTPPGAAGGIVARPDGPKLARKRPVSADPALARKYLPAVRRAAKAAGFGRYRIGASHLKVVAGPKLPAPHVALVVLEVPARGAADDPTAGYLSALLLGDSTGAISDEVLAIDERLDHFEVDYFVDIGDDGIDEVGFSSSYYEGAYDLLLQWADTDPDYVTLSGDGA